MISYRACFDGLKYIAIARRIFLRDLCQIRETFLICGTSTSCYGLHFVLKQSATGGTIHCFHGHTLDVQINRGPFFLSSDLRNNPRQHRLGVALVQYCIAKVDETETARFTVWVLILFFAAWLLWLIVVRRRARFLPWVWFLEASNATV